VLRRAGAEGTGSYGAALTRHLRRQDLTVTEVNRPDRAARRRHGTTQPPPRRDELNPPARQEPATASGSPITRSVGTDVRWSATG
jgi:hypothetical protein